MIEQLQRVPLTCLNSWDEEEDGDWVAPTVPNPKCEERGCGPWEKPTINNPAYKGKWT